MKLRKDQRYTLYCILLEEAESINDIKYPGLCKLIQGITGLWPCLGDLIKCSNWVSFKELAPELFKYSNSFYGLYWFANWGERIKALKQCIKETENF